MGIQFLPVRSAAGTAFTPADTITSTSVQSAIVEALTDARAYSDQVASGLDPKAAVNVATAAVLPGTISYTTVNEINSDVALGVIDGTYTPVNDDRILVKNQVSAQYNGIYVVTSAASPFKLTRSADADNNPGSEVTSGIYCSQLFGEHAAMGWVLTSVDPINLNIDPLTFSPFAINSVDATKVVNTPAGNIAAVTVQAAINELDTDKAALTGATFTGRVVETPTALTSSSNSVAINAAVGNTFTYLTVENSTLAAPSNPVSGQYLTLVITQGTPVRTLAFNTFYSFPAGYVPALTATVGARDTFVCYIEDATHSTCRMISDLKRI